MRTQVERDMDLFYEMEDRIRAGGGQKHDDFAELLQVMSHNHNNNLHKDPEGDYKIHIGHDGGGIPSPLHQYTLPDHVRTVCDSYSGNYVARGIINEAFGRNDIREWQTTRQAAHYRLNFN